MSTGLIADWLTADTGTIVDVNGFLQYGAVGLIAALGVVFFRLAYKRESERADRIEAKYDRIMDKVIPVLLESAAVTKQNMEVLKDVQNKIMPVLTELERQSRRDRER